MIKIDDNHVVMQVGGKLGGNALIQVAARDRSYGNGWNLNDAIVRGKHVSWGPMDNQPNIMRKLVLENNLVEALLEAQRDMIYGSGLGFARRAVSPDGSLSLKPIFDQRLEDWREATLLDNFFIDAINQRTFTANLFTRFEWDIAQGWPKLGVSDCFFTRIGVPDNQGRVSKYSYNPFMGEYRWRENENESIDAFNRLAPRGSQVSILHSKETKPGNPFYAFPSWWTSSKVIELANLIPEFHTNGIINGYNIKYLIKMPKDYYDSEYGKASSPAAIQQKWDGFSDKMQRWFGNVKNVNKTLVVKYKRGEDGKPVDNIEVIPLKNEMSDDAYSQIWDSSSVQLSNAIGMPPLLAGVTPSSRGGGSGSEIRNTSDYYQHQRTNIHKHFCLEPITVAMRAMGYSSDVVPIVREVQLTSLDKNPNGAQAVVNHNQ